MPYDSDDNLPPLDATSAALPEVVPVLLENRAAVASHSVELPVLPKITPAETDFTPRKEETERPGNGKAAPGATKPRPKSKRQVERVQRRQMAYLQKRRQQKQLRIIYNRIRAIFRLGFAALWIYCIYLLLQSSFWYMDQPRFLVQNQHLLTRGHLAPYIEKLTGQPMIAIDPAALEQEIKALHPVLDRVYVRRYLFPARLEITLIEKKPWAEVYNSETAKVPYALVGHDYSIIPLRPYKYNPSQYSRSPMTRLVIPRATPLTRKQLERLDQLAYQLKHVPQLNLQRLILTEPNQVKAQGQDFNVYIGRLDREILTRLQPLPSLMPALYARHKTVEGVDLRWSDQITLRKRTTGAPAATSTDATDASQPSAQQPPIVINSAQPVLPSQVTTPRE